MKKNENNNVKKDDMAWVTGLSVIIACLLIGGIVTALIMKNNYRDGQIDALSGKNVIVKEYKDDSGVSVWVEKE